jgi:hypothetical protein
VSSYEERLRAALAEIDGYLDLCRERYEEANEVAEATEALCMAHLSPDTVEALNVAREGLRGMREAMVLWEAKRDECLTLLKAAEEADCDE